MSLYNCPANTWTKIATNVSTCKVSAVSKTQFVHTYRTTGTAAPTAGNATEGVKAFKNGNPEFYNATEGIDVYVMALGVGGIVRVDTDLKHTVEKAVKYTGGLKLVSQVTSAGLTNSPTDLTISDDGRFAYGALGSSDGVAWFSINQTTGELTYISRIVNGTLYNNATVPALSPEGNHLYLASKDNDAVSWFTVNKNTGALTYVGQYSNATNIPKCSCVVVSNDGRHVYVGSTNTVAGATVVAAFSRNVETGELTYIENYMHANYKSTQTVIMSKDDAFVYFACSGMDSLLIFTRNASDGKLTYSTKVTDNTNLDGVRSIVLSPDGLFMYCASYNANTVNVYSVNTSTGALTLVEHITSATYLNYCYQVCVTWDCVYVTARNDNSFAVFKRNPTTGALTYVQSIRVTGATETRCIMITPDNRFAIANAIGTHEFFSFFRMV